MIMQNDSMRIIDHQDLKTVTNISKLPTKNVSNKKTVTNIDVAPPSRCSF